MKKPKKLPDWVWEAYVHGFDELLSHGDVPRASPNSPAGPVNQILNDSRCAVVWNAIQRRELRGTFQQPEKRKGVRNQVGELLNAVREACAGPLPHGGATETERKRGKRIADLADGLARELVTLRTIENGALPWEVVDELARFGRALERNDRRKYGAAIELDKPVYEDVIYDAAEAAPTALRAFARGARKWSMGTPIVRRPEGSTNPQRLYFIRHMHASFQRAYGSPLHDSTAALASAVFGEEILGNTVSKLTRSDNA